MLQLAIEGLDTLRNEIPNILGENLNKTALKIILAKYYEYSSRFCISKADKILLNEKFNEIVLAEFSNMSGEKYDIENLIKEMYPLGIPEYKRKQVQKAIKKHQKEENDKLKIQLIFDETSGTSLNNL